VTNARVASPTLMSLEVLRERGYVADKDCVVERRIPCGKFSITRDYINVVDLVVFHPQHGILAIQASTGANHAARLEKVLAEPRARVWLEAGGRLAVWTWSKTGAAGTRKLWQLREQELTLEDFDNAASSADERREQNPPDK